MRNKEKQREKEQKKREQIEVKEPLDDEKDEHIIENHQNQNYLARLDEFSMVSATLGSK